MTFDEGANRLGALALRVADRLEIETRRAADSSFSTTTALSAIHHLVDGPSIDHLSRMLGLSSSATVRLVDGLVERGLAKRSPGADARVSVVALTAAGRRRAKVIGAARADALVDALAVLSAEERATFCALVDKILVGLVRGPAGRGWMCRLCDAPVCGAERGQPCPITLTALG